MSLRALYLEGIGAGRDVSAHDGRPDAGGEPPWPPTGQVIDVTPICGRRDARGDACRRIKGHRGGCFRADKGG